MSFDHASFIYGLSGMSLEQINTSTGVVLYLHHDQQGSTRLLTGSTGNTEATFTYGAYGELTGHTGTATTPLGYDAQYTSADTGLIYLRSRVYDPATAQFLTADPIEAQTREPYVYGADDPTAYTDPTGRAIEIEVPEAPSYLPHLSPEGQQAAEELLTEARKKINRAREELNGEQAGEEGNGAAEVKERQETECGKELVREGEELLGRRHSPSGKAKWQEWWDGLGNAERKLYKKFGGPRPRSWT